MEKIPGPLHRSEIVKNPLAAFNCLDHEIGIVFKELEHLRQCAHDDYLENEQAAEPSDRRYREHALGRECAYVTAKALIADIYKQFG